MSPVVSLSRIRSNVIISAHLFSDMYVRMYTYSLCLCVFAFVCLTHHEFVMMLCKLIFSFSLIMNIFEISNVIGTDKFYKMLWSENSYDHK